jgi:hypothetical protein
MAPAATSDLLERARALEVDLGVDVELVDPTTGPTAHRAAGSIMKLYETGTCE